MECFFVMPLDCRKILYSATNIKSCEEIKKRGFFKKLYNYFICTDKVAVYVKNGVIKENFILYSDSEFLKKIPKNSYKFYIKVLEEFFKNAKKELQKGKTIYLYFEDYKFKMSKYKFSAYKSDKLIVKNYLSEIKYGELDEIILNPYTNKKIKFYAPKTVYEFFEYYMENAKFKNNLVDVKRKNDYLLLIYAILNLVVFLVFTFGIMFLLWYVDVLICGKFEPVRALIEGIVAIALGEFISDVFKSKFYY